MFEVVLLKTRTTSYLKYEYTRFILSWREQKNPSALADGMNATH